MHSYYYFFNNNPVIGLNLSIPFNITVLLSVFLISFLPVIFAIWTIVKIIKIINNAFIAPNTPPKILFVPLNIPNIFY